MDYKQIKAIESEHKKKWIKHFGAISDGSGIYILTREENGFKYAYVGQAKHILTRLAQHLSGYQHIDISLKKHGLWSEDNITGWRLGYFLCDDLDNAEQDFIKRYANMGYQLRNKTAGGQGEGKFEIDETKPKKTYRDGLKQGYVNAQKEIAHLFEKNLTFGINGKENKNKIKAFDKFKKFIDLKKY